MTLHTCRGERVIPLEDLGTSLSRARALNLTKPFCLPERKSKGNKHRVLIDSINDSSTFGGGGGGGFGIEWSGV